MADRLRRALQGGGLVLAFFTRPAAPPAPETVKLFSGVIASSPFIQLTHPKPKLLRWAGNKLTHVVPWLLFPADVGYQVRFAPLYVHPLLILLAIL